MHWIMCEHPYKFYEHLDKLLFYNIFVYLGKVHGEDVVVKITSKNY